MSNDRYERIRKALAKGAYLTAICDRDTIRELLAERDALRDFVEAKMHHLPIEDRHVASILVGEQEAGR